jgi:hypothetical protein
MKRWLSVVSALAALGFAACGDDDPGRPRATIPVRYAYTGFDSTGTKITQGILEIVYRLAGDDDRGPAAASVTGTWDIVQIAGPPDIGPQAGKGVLEGEALRNKRIALNLNPEFLDANVFLTGAFDSALFGSFRGEWTYVSFAGVENYGTYRAVKT